MPTDPTAPAPIKLHLNTARINARLTQAAAAEKLGVSRDTLGNWERGESYPNALQILRIEDVYGVRFADLLFLPKDEAPGVIGCKNKSRRYRSGAGERKG